MKTLQKIVLVSPIVALLICIHAQAADSISLEAGAGEKVHLARVGAQWSWEQRWWQSNGTHLGGYWDLTLARWRATRYQDMNATQNITDIGLTPVFRFQNDSTRGWYGEFGIGAHYLSELYDNNEDQLSTRFEFGDHLGLGYVFANKLDVGVKIQHFSNGGIKKPNSGVEFAVIRVSYPFN